MSEHDECEKCREMEPTYCFDGILYGMCASEWCGGGCEDRGPCDCECHPPEPDEN